MTASRDPNIKFLHFRFADETTGAISPRGGVTVAYRLNDDGTLTSASAFCHIKDNFNRAVGRIKATGQLNSAKRAVKIQPIAEVQGVELCKAYVANLTQVYETSEGPAGYNIVRSYSRKQPAAE